MRFLVDESSGIAVARYLASEGHDVLAVADTAPQIADPDILRWAQREGRIVITNDKDFGDLVFRSSHPHSGILLLRLRDESPANKVAVVAGVISRYAEQMPGNFVVASETKTRIRE